MSFERRVALIVALAALCWAAPLTALWLLWR